MTDIASTDIWRAANIMVDLYGSEATLKAAMRDGALLDQGDTEGFFVWTSLQLRKFALGAAKLIKGQGLC